MRKSIDTQKGFSFRESAKLEKEIAETPSFQFRKRTNSKELFVMRTILDYSKIENQLNSNLAGRIYRREADLAVSIFQVVITSKIWQNICWNGFAWKDGVRINLDQTDLMIICRNVAKEILRKG